MVSEVCFRVLSGEDTDLEYMSRLLRLIEEHRVPAPCPIEQRWSSASSSAMSPAAGSPADLFSWVGVIMYLPDEPSARREVAAKFKAYRQLCVERLFDGVQGVEHWAKVEPGDTPRRAKAQLARIAGRLPLHEFNAARRRLDPKGVLSAGWVNSVLGAATDKDV